jgi:hypothetical protein
MFFGELLCLAAYGAKVLYQRRKDGYVEVKKHET